jgi:hypothetical protein
VNQVEMGNHGCNLIGYVTNEKGNFNGNWIFDGKNLADDFLKERRVLRTHIEKWEKPPKDDDFQHYRSRIHDNFTACYVRIFNEFKTIIFLPIEGRRRRPIAV